MRVSVVVRTRDEADRLRLTLASLAGQTRPPADIVVVDDGSADHTRAVLTEAAAASRVPLTVVTHDRVRGRSAASNAGARTATGDVLLFLDGDTLAGPDCVARHEAAHAAAAGPELLVVGRGETFHLRGTRRLLDPETAAPQAEHAAWLGCLPAAEIDRLRVTRAQVAGDFAAIDRRAEPGLYPGAGPRLLYELEMDALRRHPGCGVLWAAASGSNLSVRADAFHSAAHGGGFDEALDINEHRELALRLCGAGARMVPVDGARTYHMTHRAGWRDPLRDMGWETVFYRRHPIPAVQLLVVFWAGLSARSDGGAVPADARIGSLPELEAAAASGSALRPEHARARRMILASAAGSAAAAAA